MKNLLIILTVTLLTSCASKYKVGKSYTEEVFSTCLNYENKIVVMPDNDNIDRQNIRRVCTLRQRVYITFLQGLDNTQRITNVKITN